MLRCSTVFTSASWLDLAFKGPTGNPNFVHNIVAMADMPEDRFTQGYFSVVLTVVTVVW